MLLAHAAFSGGRIKLLQDVRKSFFGRRVFLDRLAFQPKFMVGKEEQAGWNDEMFFVCCRRYVNMSSSLFIIFLWGLLKRSWHFQDRLYMRYSKLAENCDKKICRKGHFKIVSWRTKGNVRRSMGKNTSVYEGISVREIYARNASGYRLEILYKENIGRYKKCPSFHLHCNESHVN